MSAREKGLKLVDALLRGRSEEAIQILKEKGDVDFSIENKGDNAIHLAARRGDVNVIKAMQDKGADMGQKNLAQNTPMHYAAKGGYMELVAYLRDNGAKLNAKNADGECPLHEAVKTQTMDIIETLIDMGMDPNVRNKEGETPLHTALKYGAMEAMEALLIKKAQPNVIDKAGRKPKDVAKNVSIRESFQINSTIMSAMQSGNIKAKGMKIKRKDVSKPVKIDRVGIIIESIDIPKEFPTGFYCRREKAENATVKLPDHEEETVISDIFHIRIFEVNRNCQTKISLPAYKPPTEKEQLVIRIINENEIIVVENYETVNKTTLCMLETTLIPETTCVCVIYVRPKKEENKISEEGATITSEIEKDFSLEVPAGSFEGETVLSLTVFETNSDEYVDIDDEDEAEDTKSESDNASKRKRTDDTDEPKPKSSENKEGDDEENQETKEESTEPPAKKSDLLTDVYQINISGEQPKKGVKVQIPLCKGMTADDDIAIVHADENDLENESTMEILQTKPQIVGMNLVFEVTQFCIYVASWKKKVASKEDRVELQRQISMTRDKRKPAALFAVVKLVEGLKHIMVVECVVATKSNERRRRWLEKEAYEIQNPPEAGEIMMTPGDTFYVNVEGNAVLEDEKDATDRKLQFYQIRSSWQPYYVNLNEGIYDEENAVGYVVVSKQTDTGLEETARLRIKLTPPPRPPTPPPPETHTDQAELAMDKFKDRLKPCEEVIEPETVVELIQDVRPKSPLTSRRPTPLSSVRRPQSSASFFRPKTAPQRSYERQYSQEAMTVVVEKFATGLKPSYKPESSIADRFNKSPFAKKTSKVTPANSGGRSRKSSVGDSSSRAESRQSTQSSQSSKSGSSDAVSDKGIKHRKWKQY